MALTKMVSLSGSCVEYQELTLCVDLSLLVLEIRYLFIDWL